MEKESLMSGSGEAGHENTFMADTGFMREKIKQRPINKTKLLRRTLLTITMAVIFGLVACVTFIFLQPFITNRLYPEPEAETVVFPEETVEEEMQPEDMYADDAAIAQEAEDLAQEESAQITNEIRSIIRQETESAAEIRSIIRQETESAARTIPHDISDLSELYASLRGVMAEVRRSMVTVTAITPDTNWLSGEVERNGVSSGLIIAENNGYLLILTSSEDIARASDIVVEFPDGTSVRGKLRMDDSVSSLAVVEVSKSILTKECKDALKIADLGSSSAGAGVGTPVIAVGSPCGVDRSVGHGMITADKTVVDLPDTAYKLLHTDIPGDDSGSGVIADLNGRIIGIIAMDYAEGDRISALGITELKPLIENLSNRKEHIYTGIHTVDVPEGIRRIQNIPDGAYVSQVDLDSPAMLAGIQSGDIITGLNDENITGFEMLTVRLMRLTPDDEIILRVKRQVPDGYADMEYTFTPKGTRKEQ